MSGSGGSPSNCGSSPARPTSPSLGSSSASTATVTHPAPPDTVLTALNFTPFKTKNTRRDLTTSYRAFKQAWSAIERTTVLQHSARRLGERAANVLLVTTDKLQAYEPKDARDKILGKVPTYEFQAEANPQETMFKLQSIMIDLQTAMTLLASPRQDQQVLLVRDLSSTVRSLEKLNAQLTNAVEMYELFISTEPWALENEHDLAADYATLPRLFQLAFALRGPLYTGFLKDHPAPPGEIASISKRRDNYLAWCLETNPLLRQDPSTPTSARKRWVLITPSPEASPVSPLFPKGGAGTVPVLSRSRAPSSPTAAAPAGGSRRVRSSTMINEVSPSPPSIKAGTVVETKDIPSSPTTSPETSPTIPSSSPWTASLSNSPKELSADTPDSTPPTTPQIVTSIYPNTVADRASRLSTEPDEHSFLSIGDHPNVSSDSSGASDDEPDSPTSGTPRQLPRLLENGSSKSSPASEVPPAKGLGILDSLNAAVTTEPDAAPDSPVEEKKSNLLSSPRSPRRVPSIPTLPAIPEDELYRPEPPTPTPIPSFIVRPATPQCESLQAGEKGSTPQTTSLRILSLDGGGIRGLTLLYTLRSKLAKDSPPPYQVFDLITGCGTGGLVAILLGRLRMTIDEAINTYLSIARQAFISKELVRKKSRWSRLFGGPGSTADRSEIGKLLPGTRDHGLEEALLEHLDDVPMLEESSALEAKRCKVAILAYEQSSYGGDGAPVWFRSYLDDNDENLDSPCIRTVVRATMASSAFFRPFKLAEERASFIVAPESLNPADLTLDEAHRISETLGPDATELPKLEIVHFLSLGVGQIPSGIRLSSKTKMRSLKLVTRIVEENQSAYERVLRRARREGWSERIERIDVDLVGRDDKGIDEWFYHILLRDAIERFVNGGDLSTTTSGAADRVGSGDFEFPSTTPTETIKSTNPRREYPGLSLFGPPNHSPSSPIPATSMLSTFTFRRSSIQRLSLRPESSSSSSATSPLRRSVSLTNLRTSLNPMYLQRDASTASLDADVARDSLTNSGTNTAL
ncbi:BZ3500_MvSof-1268-A1-R1_Chr5-2g08014 [Microbotryum saponariae]|uniref:BZ3500_MvSof-1268-A1-R1_Chr5-2g08014 protein n=1 Tax=Microbotryum saponariae TaxID=289078 RepID=A0A2X0KMT5_9BASI|nr:BZ3500_MvSof-1268-A1-R1_Chr5-2g08014 [Microbotryum saponariae]SDA05883.1 BZ3501_MvSof-1269-A2-R1_Chr5-2g07836 [Microbotryum saponariae]